jgi:zinc protease
MKHITISLLLSLMMSVFIVAQEKPKNETPKDTTTDATKTDATKKEEKPAGSTTAASPTAALPTIDEILAKYVKALGGKEACLKLNSRTVKGTFQIETMNASGSVESFTKAPNKTSTIITIDGFGTINSVFDGSKGWSNDPFNGFRELSGLELAALKRDSDFYSMLNFDKNYTKLAVKGTEKVASSEAYVVEATPTEGATEKFYFDVKSGLLVRHDSERESPQGKMATEQYLEDYKLIDGVYFPHTMKQVTPMFALTVKFTEVKNNTEIEETKFNKPTPTQ